MPLRLLEQELIRTGISVPPRTTATGRSLGSGRFTRGQLYLLLKNVIYTGRIGHKDKVYAGLHPAIIDEATFAAVQASLADNVRGHRSRAGAAETSLLAGKVVDGAIVTSRCN